MNSPNKIVRVMLEDCAGDLWVHWYEEILWAAETVYEGCLADLCHTLETTTMEPGEQLDKLKAGMMRCRDRFLVLDVRRDNSHPLIGIVGEIFCRLNTYSNDDLVKCLEVHGAGLELGPLRVDLVHQRRD